MDYYKINFENPEPEIIKKAAKVIKSGGIVVYPTDTLYGFGVNIFDEQAMDRLFQLKDRQSGKPISILINDLKQAQKLVGKLTALENQAVSLFFPGKVTLLFKVKTENTIPRLSAFKKLGFRIPDSKLTHQLVEYAGGPISTTSVNLSSKENIKNINEAVSVFADKIDLIMDAGPVKSTKGSTVMDLTTHPPTILRKGDIPRKDIVDKFGFDLSTNYTGKFVITFVCSGNICRSPMGAGILQKIISRTKFKNIVNVNSAGTLDLPMTPAHINAVEVAEKYEIDLNRHLSRHAQARIVREANLIIALALDHYNYLRSHFPLFKEKVILLKQWKKSHHLTNPSIADPIGHEIEFFEKTFKELQNEIRRVLPFILNKINKYTRENSIIL